MTLINAVRWILLAVTAIAVAGSAAAAAAGFWQIPPVATNQTPVTLKIGIAACESFWPAVVTRTGTNIQVHMDVKSGCIISASPPLEFKVSLGVLPAGNYSVELFRKYGVQPTGPEAVTTLVVHDVTTFAIWPSGAQSAATPRPRWDIHLPLLVHDVPDDTEIRIGPQLVDHFNGSIYLPEGVSEGVFDVTVVKKGVTTIARNAFTFTTKACTDPRIWERVLIPIQFDGPGAFGSQWKTYLDIRTNPEIDFYWSLEPPNRYDGCTVQDLDPSRPRYVPSPGDGARGYFLWVPRTLAPAYRYALAVQEISRDRDAMPETIPVPREADWKSGHSVINTPFIRNARATLRLYGLDDDVIGFHVWRERTAEPRVDRYVKAARFGADEPKFATIDVTDLLDRAGNLQTPLFISANPDHGRYWAMLTVTDNDTQRFEVFTPQ